MAIRLGVSPLSWVNSDIPEFAALVSVEHCLSEAALIGFEGVELEDPFRRRITELPILLRSRKLCLIGGWHSSFVLENSLDEEKSRLQGHLDTLRTQGSNLLILADCTAAVHRDPKKGLSERPILNEAQWELLCTGVNALAKHAHEQGFKTAYHPHMGTVVQSESDIDRLMEGCGDLGLLIDPGHLAYAQADFLGLTRRHISRVKHIHFKNVRRPLLKQMLDTDSPFVPAIKQGVFTVPGDDGAQGNEGLDFRPLVEVLVEAEYDGWFVVEAEQDPRLANPLLYARLGYHTLSQLISQACIRRDAAVLQT